MAWAKVLQGLNSVFKKKRKKKPPVTAPLTAVVLPYNVERMTPEEFKRYKKQRKKGK